MKVSDIMSSHVITANQREPVTAAARLMKRHNLGVLPVCDDSGALRGLVTDRDIVLRCVALDGVGTAAGTMGREQIRRIPVVDGGRVVGMVSLADMARRERLSMEAAAALGDISGNIRRG